MSAKKILAISSKGGHFVQLLRLMPLFEKHETIFVSTYDEYAIKNYHAVVDANLNTPFRLVRQLFSVIYLFIRYRPDIVVSTGASVGFFAIFIGSMLRKKTVWIDSIANANEMSLSGKKAKRYAELWLTQWPELEGDQGPFYKGSVL